MNKIHTINLGGHPFTVDEDAFEYLQAYIRSLRKHFKNSAGCEEIIGDIESRLAELLTERLDGRTYCDPTGGQRGHLYHGIPGRIRS